MSTCTEICNNEYFDNLKITGMVICQSNDNLNNNDRVIIHTENESFRINFKKIINITQNINPVGCRLTKVECICMKNMVCKICFTSDGLLIHYIEIVGEDV